MVAFAPRNYQAITQAAVAWLQANPDLSTGILPTDLSVGSLERAHIEAMALMMEEYDQRIVDAIKQAIRESCFHAFGFDKLPASQATGSVYCASFVAVPYEITIPQGTVFQGPNGVLFASTAPSSIAEGGTQSAEIPVQAQVAGAIGNVAENTVTKIVSPINYVDIVNNPLPIWGGGDEETEDARALRFSGFIKTLQRGTKEALEFCALTVPSGKVADARAIEPFLLEPRPSGIPYAGHVWLFIDDGTAATTLPQEIEDEVHQYVYGFVDGLGNAYAGYKAAGIIVDILKAAPKSVQVRGKVKIAPGSQARWGDIQSNLTAASVNYFRTLRIAEPSSYQNLVTALTTCDPDIREVQLNYWLATDAVPGYESTIVAAAIDPYDSEDPTSVGARLIAAQGATNGITYPEWILA